MEQWEAIEGYKGRYEVSDQGNVRSLVDNRGRAREVPKILKHVIIGHGPDNFYPAVNLYKDKKVRQFSIHRLVAIAFIPNPDNLPFVNHKDEDTFNCAEENLEWCSPQYNQEYSLAKEYRMLSPDGEEVLIFNMRKFCRDNNLNHAHMYQVHKGNLGQHKGWRAL